MSEVIVYSAGYCPYCHRAKHLLEELGIGFEEIEVDREPEKRAEMQQRSGRRTIPQIFIGADHVGGFDDLAAASRSGKLDEILDKNGIERREKARG